MSQTKTSLFSATIVVSMFLLSAGNSANALPAKKDAAHSRISFVAYTKLFDAEGIFKKWNVSGEVNPDDFTQSKIQISVDVATVDSDSKQRDDHLLEEDFFFVKKYPKATFKTTSITRGKGPNQFIVKGPLTIRGVTKTISMPVTAETMTNKKGKKVVRVKGTKKLIRQDYGLNYVSGLLMPTIRDDVTLSIDINFRGE